MNCTIVKLFVNRFGLFITRASLAVVMSSLLVSAAQAQTAVKPAGLGTIGSPYQISQLGNLVWMSESAWSDQPRYYKFMNDIDASVTASWNGGEGFTPIDAYLNMTGSGGVIDGNGKVIRNLTIKLAAADQTAGLFSHLGEGWVLKDLGLEGLVVVSGSDPVGGLVGWNSGAINGCYVSGSVAQGSGSGNFVGCLVGWNEGTITGCCAMGSVSGRTVYGSSVGGIAGVNVNGTIVDCYATSSATGASIVGGLVGQNYGGIVNRCYAVGRVALTGTIPDPYLGGLVGCASDQIMRLKTS